jgi:hypothetical protein
VDIELLVVPDCPNESVAFSRLNLAVERLGLQAQPVRTTVVGDYEQAVKRGFVGSPTILIDGEDPFAVPGQAPAMACRMYATPTGLTGVPPLEDLVVALASARERGRQRP